MVGARGTLLAGLLIQQVKKKGFIQSVPKRMKADDSLGTVCVLRIKGVFVEV